MAQTPLLLALRCNAAPRRPDRTLTAPRPHLDLDDLDALKVERDENDQRKPPTTSERVALAEAIAERLNDRKGSNQYVKKEGPEIFPDAHGDTRDIAARIDIAACISIDIDQDDRP